MALRSDRQRLDTALVERGLVASRARARDLIRRGLVQVAGRVETKPAAMVGGEVPLTLLSEVEARHVSRGAAKLTAALSHFALTAKDRVALDIGASTGGFTEVLLGDGASRVFAVDVGHGQLHPRLAGDSRVVSLEGCDARTLDATRVPVPIDAVVADVSFIALAKVLPAAMALTRPGAWLVALVKPQFEVGPEAVGKGGIVRDAEARQRALDGVTTWVAAQPGWRVMGAIESPITGGSGNVEYLLAAVREK